MRQFIEACRAHESKGGSVEWHEAGEYYFHPTCEHHQNQVLYMQKNIAIVSQLVSRGILDEHSSKKVQFSTVFHLLSKGRSMLQYKESRALFKHLEVKNMERLHWSDNAR